MVKNTVIGSTPGDRESLPPLVGRSCVPLPPARSNGWSPFSEFESFPLCYTAGRNEGARRGTKIELMKEPADRAILFLQGVSELLLV